MTPKLPTALLRAAVALSLFAFPAALLAQPAAPAAPTTKPAGPMPTAEQKAEVDAYNSANPAVPLQKKTWTNRDGSVNTDFGKPNKRFMELHAEFLERSHKPAEVLFIGDSITEGWRNTKKKDDPDTTNPDPKETFATNYGKYHAANFGISGDRTEHVLWRIQDGELDGFKNSQPKVVVIMIGTNNSGRPAEEIAAGTTAVVKATHEKLPESKILLLSIFPRAATAEAGARKKVEAANEILKNLDGSMDGKVKYFALWSQFLEADGDLPKSVMPDLLHPNAKGYVIWAEAMKPVLEDLLK